MSIIQKLETIHLLTSQKKVANFILDKKVIQDKKKVFNLLEYIIYWSLFISYRSNIDSKFLCSTVTFLFKKKYKLLNKQTYTRLSIRLETNQKVNLCKLAISIKNY